MFLDKEQDVRTSAQNRTEEAQPMKGGGDDDDDDDDDYDDI